MDIVAYGVTAIASLIGITVLMIEPLFVYDEYPKSS